MANSIGLFDAQLEVKEWFAADGKIQGWFDSSLIENAVTSYSLSGLAGSYSYTGQNATVARAVKLLGSNGSYAYSGQTATVKKAVKLSGNNGSYAYSGQASTLTRTVKLSGNAGAYSYSGQAATLARSVKLAGNAGSYTYAGQSATSVRAIKLSGNFGNYTYSGQWADLLYNPGIVAWTKHGGDDAPKKHESKRLKKLKLRKDIEEAWAKVTGETAPIEIKEKALELIPADIQQPTEWIAKDFERVQKLLALWERQVQEQDDEEVLMLLM